MLRWPSCELLSPRHRDGQIASYRSARSNHAQEAGAGSLELRVRGQEPALPQPCQREVLCVVGLRPPKAVRNSPGLIELQQSAQPASDGVQLPRASSYMQGAGGSPAGFLHPNDDPSSDSTAYAALAKRFAPVSVVPGCVPKTPECREPRSLGGGRLWTTASKPPAGGRLGGCY
jgi:hypothetical protein